MKIFAAVNVGIECARKLPFLFDRVGRWWGGKDTEIDIVAVDTNDRSNILFGECKFHQNTQMQLLNYAS